MSATKSGPIRKSRAHVWQFNLVSWLMVRRSHALARITLRRPTPVLWSFFVGLTLLATSALVSASYAAAYHRVAFRS
jgi:hypothetical protein